MMSILLWIYNELLFTPLLRTLAALGFLFLVVLVFFVLKVRSGQRLTAPTGPVSVKAKEAFEEASNSQIFAAKLGVRRSLRRRLGCPTSTTAQLHQAVLQADGFESKLLTRGAGGAVHVDGSGRLLLVRGWMLRWAPLLGRDALQHELVHACQELENQLLSRERDNTLSAVDELVAELDACVFGSSLLFLALLVGFGWFACLLYSLAGG